MPRLRTIILLWLSLDLHNYQTVLEEVIQLLHNDIDVASCGMAICNCMEGVAECMHGVTPDREPDYLFYIAIRLVTWFMRLVAIRGVRYNAYSYMTRD